MWLRFYTEDKTGVSIIDSIPHGPTENATYSGKNKYVRLRFLHNTKIGVPIIDSIPLCHSEYALKRGKNQEMWLRYYIEDKVYVSSIVFHTAIRKIFQ